MEQIRNRPSKKAGSNLVKQRRRGYSYPLGHHVMQGEADHRVTRVFGLEDVVERDRKESIAEKFG
jgi:hypothetical protein